MCGCCWLCWLCVRVCGCWCVFECVCVCGRMCVHRGRHTRLRVGCSRPSCFHSCSVLQCVVVCCALTTNCNTTLKQTATHCSTLRRCSCVHFFARADARTHTHMLTHCVFLYIYKHIRTSKCGMDTDGCRMVVVGLERDRTL